MHVLWLIRSRRLMTEAEGQAAVGTLVHGANPLWGKCLKGAAWWGGRRVSSPVAAFPALRREPCLTAPPWKSCCLTA